MRPNSRPGPAIPHAVSPLLSQAAFGDRLPRETPPGLRRPVAIDVFSGAGGMSLGFEAAGFDVVAAVDKDPVHLATYGYNFPLTELLYRDVETLTGTELLQVAETGIRNHSQTARWDGVVDCLFGGPPCQSFSSMGRQQPDDERAGLVDHFARLVCELRPRSFVMENVPGMLQPRNHAVLQRALSAFTEAGYRLVSDGPFVLDASVFGVPQRRRRVFVVGISADTPFRAGIPTGYVPEVTVGDAIGDLVNVDLFAALMLSDEMALHDGTARWMDENASSYASELRSASWGACYPRIWEKNVLTSSMRTLHSQEVVERWKAVAPGDTDVASRQPRLHSDRLSPVLRAGTGSDHGSHTSCRPIHPRDPRVITVREGARLHGYPDWMRFHRTKWHGFRQVGNSVPPPLARAVASEVA